MTDEQRASADGEGVPALMRHISEMQEMSCDLYGLLEAIAYLDNEGKCEVAMPVLIDLARKMADDLNRGLDSVMLPKVAA